MTAQRNSAGGRQRPGQKREGGGKRLAATRKKARTLYSKAYRPLDWRAESLGQASPLVKLPDWLRSR